MDAHLKLWLDAEMKDFSGVFHTFNKRLMKKVPIWMAISVVGMVALGFAVGGGVMDVLKLHFPIGCGFAVFIWLCFWLQTRSVSMAKVRRAYETALAQALPTQPEQAAFAWQMETKNYGKCDFLNGTTDKYPCRLLIGPDYWFYFRSLGCTIVRAADVARLHSREETTRVGYTVGNTRVRQSIGVGVSLIIEYKPDSPSARSREQDRFYLEKEAQLRETLDLIRKYCPRSADFFG